MANILAIDTSSEGCSVALSIDDRVEAIYLDAPRQHTQKILPLIDDLLGKTGITLAQCEAIVYGRGPGSFTGLRICLGVAQGLGYAIESPLVAVSSFDTLIEEASHLYRLSAGDKVLVAIDARMEEVYWRVYRYSGEEFEPVTDESLSSPEQVVQALSDIGLLALKLGSGCTYPALTELSATAEHIQLQPKAEFMLPVARRMLARGEVVAPECAEPTYLRDSVAWQKRQRIRTLCNR